MREDTSASQITRIKGELVAALSALTCVRRIDSFGSVATGRADRWSDLDLLVSCELVERTAWLAAAAIRRAKRVTFYRTFTGVAQPSGRYWFDGESPFHRLDVSFYSPADYAAICRSGLRSEHLVAVKPEHVSHVSVAPSADARLLAPADREEVTQRETDIGRLLYRHLETAKNQMRGRQGQRTIVETRAALLDATSCTPRMPGDEAVMGLLARVDGLIGGVIERRGLARVAP
jgi:predicted nucleotidyltransferase